MGFLDRILGTQRAPEHRAPPSGRFTDEQALERYRYMLRTAPPETVEQAHAEAFEQLTPEQRRQLLASIASAAPPHERAAVTSTSPDDPRAMGRLATRAEMRRPGFMEQTLRGAGGIGLGGSLLSSFAVGFLGSMVANSFFASMSASAMDPEAPEPEADTEPDPDPAVEGTDTGGDMGDGGGFDF